MPATEPAALTLHAEHAEFMRRGVSVCVASRDVRHVPSLARGLACVVEPGGRRVRLVMVRPQCEVLLRDIEKSGQVAVVCTRPSTHRALQVKGSDAQVEPASAEDVVQVQACFEAFADDLLLLGFPPDFTRLYYDHTEADLVTVTFTPDAVFQQTPGPDAGARLEPRP